MEEKDIDEWLLIEMHMSYHYLLSFYFQSMEDWNISLLK